MAIDLLLPPPSKTPGISVESDLVVVVVVEPPVAFVVVAFVVVTPASVADDDDPVDTGSPLVGASSAPVASLELLVAPVTVADVVASAPHARHR